MPQAVVQVSYVNQPGVGKKLGTIKDANGAIYGVPPSMLGLVQQGGTYELFFEDREWQGKTYHTVRSIKPYTSQTVPAAQRVLGAAERARTNSADAERMWTCALLGHAIQAGKVDPFNESEVISVGRIMRGAHRLIFMEEADVFPPDRSPQTKVHPESAEEMNDSLPY